MISVLRTDSKPNSLITVGGSLDEILSGRFGSRFSFDQHPWKKRFQFGFKGGKFFVVGCVKFIGYGKEKFIVGKNLKISEIKRFWKFKIIVLAFSYFNEMHKGNEK